jgi:effector-binding domain-containing protein
MKTLLTLFNTLFLASCSLFGIQSVKEASYSVLIDNAPIQIRHYQIQIVAQTEVLADYKNASNQAFKRLFNYISGGNKKQQKVAMPAPVIQEAQTEKITMTAPVIQEKSGQAWLMSFVLPAHYTLATAPIPLDPAITLKEVPRKKTAVLRYSGLLSEQSIEKKTQELKTWLDEKGYKTISPARSAGFDPPWTLPFLRRNEVHIDIE